MLVYIVYTKCFDHIEFLKCFGSQNDAINYATNKAYKLSKKRFSKPYIKDALQRRLKTSNDIETFFTYHEDYDITCDEDIYIRVMDVK